MVEPDGRRLLLVHAHPDDESINTGATMARYAAEGAQVSLVTCTLGEQGEIVVPALAQLEADQADQLGGWRIAELAAAMAELGVTDYRFLGGAGRFRDSGMIDTPANEHPRAFWRAEQDRALFFDAVLALVEVIRLLRPQVVITYDEFGGYGHPDHIMAHRVTMAAVTAAAQSAYASTGPAPWSVAKLYWTCAPASVVAAEFAALGASTDLPFAVPDAIDELGPTVTDDQVDTVIDAQPYLPAKLRAMAAHTTQITVAGSHYALSNNIARRASGLEYFRLARRDPDGLVPSERARSAGPDRDLFAGVRLDDPVGVRS